MNLLLNAVTSAHKEKRRLVVPLVGLPGLNLTGSTVKLAQQNFGEHYKVLKAISETFKPDAIFPLMDLSVEANALGRYTVFPKEESATVIKDTFTFNDLEKVGKINVAYDTRLSGYVETMKLMDIGLHKSVLRGAYVTGPYTLAALLMGAEEAAIATITKEDELHKICSFTTKKIIEYIGLLIGAGAQLICILEPSAVMLGPEQFEKFSSNFVKNICSNFRYADVSTIYHICGNSMHLIEKMVESGVDALSLDSPDAGVNITEVARKVPQEIILIGNISPTDSMLRGNKNEVEKDVLKLLKEMETFPNFILSTGCDLPQEVPTDNIIAFMNTGRNYKLN